jgi:hypothetical protein
MPSKGRRVWEIPSLWGVEEEMNQGQLAPLE